MSKTKLSAKLSLKWRARLPQPMLLPSNNICPHRTPYVLIINIIPFMYCTKQVRFCSSFLLSDPLFPFKKSRKIENREDICCFLSPPQQHVYRKPPRKMIMSATYLLYILFECRIIMNKLPDPQPLLVEQNSLSVTNRNNECQCIPLKSITKI